MGNLEPPSFLPAPQELSAALPAPLAFTCPPPSKGVPAALTCHAVARRPPRSVLGPSAGDSARRRDPGGTAEGQPHHAWSQPFPVLTASPTPGAASRQELTCNPPNPRPRSAEVGAGPQSPRNGCWGIGWGRGSGRLPRDAHPQDPRALNGICGGMGWGGGQKCAPKAGLVSCTK